MPDLPLCSKCKLPVPLSRLQCDVCQTPAGFPNVKYAESAQECEALERRYQTARVDADASGYIAVLDEFEAAVKKSSAIMNRRFGDLQAWVSSPSPLYLTFHHQVDHAGRSPADNDFDEQRESVEAAINPFVFKQISFAALSIEQQGMTYYGEFTVAIKTNTIENRASLFEQNAFFFAEKQRLILGKKVPAGFRSTWETRHKLSTAKLKNKLTSSTTWSEFADVLLGSNKNDPACDFIEVHIYGDMDRRCIESVIGVAPTLRADKVLYNRMRGELAKLGVDVGGLQ